MANASNKESFLKSIGNVIHSLRDEKNMTLRNLSDTTGRSISYLSEIESGKKSPDVSVYKDIADALGIDLYNIFFKVSKEMDLDPQKREITGNYLPVFGQMEKLADNLSRNDEDEDEGYGGGSITGPNRNTKLHQNA